MDLASAYLMLLLVILSIQMKFCFAFSEKLKISNTTESVINRLTAEFQGRSSPLNVSINDEIYPNLVVLQATDNIEEVKRVAESRGLVFLRKEAWKQGPSYHRINEWGSQATGAPTCVTTVPLTGL
ncbi:hypothetical protein TNCV_1320311 [Trichonephila clavipes]|nr:hypothetical protein TNCV_1320311 [Trichonephila clavipes]